MQLRAMPVALLPLLLLGALCAPAAAQRALPEQGERRRGRGAAGRGRRRPAAAAHLPLAAHGRLPNPCMATVHTIASCPAADVLLEFSAMARGDNRAALAGWHAGSDPCGWAGVACSAGGAVTAIRLPRVGLRGTLDPNLARLTTLQQM